MQTIKIKGTTYKMGFSFLAIKHFEDITTRSITECRTTWDYLVFFYSTLKALNPAFTYTLEEFTAIMDDHPELLIQFQTAEQEFNTNPEADTTQQPVKKKWETKQVLGLWMLFLLLAASPVLVPIIFTLAWIGASLWLFMRLIKIVGKKRG